MKKQNIRPISWLRPFIFGIICFGFGGSLLTTGLDMEAAYTVLYDDKLGFLGSLFVSFGGLFLMFGVYLFFMFIKELIAEANVRAVEVSRGQKRAIIENAPKAKKAASEIPQKVSRDNKHKWEI